MFTHAFYINNIQLFTGYYKVCSFKIAMTHICVREQFKHFSKAYTQSFYVNFS